MLPASLRMQTKRGRPLMIGRRTVDQSERLSLPVSLRAAFFRSAATFSSASWVPIGSSFLSAITLPTAYCIWRLALSLASLAGLRPIAASFANLSAR